MEINGQNQLTITTVVWAGLDFCGGYPPPYLYSMDLTLLREMFFVKSGEVSIAVENEKKIICCCLHYLKRGFVLIYKYFYLLTAGRSSSQHNY